MPAQELTFSEEQFGKKLDRCLSDTVIKAGGGLVIGSVVSILFFKRRLWPAWVGTGFGIGAAYSACEKNLNSPK